MNKPYITKKHVIVEIISYVILFVSIGIAVFFVATHDGDVVARIGADGPETESKFNVLAMPLIMFACNVLVSVIAHFFPTRLWSMPFTPKPGRELIVFIDCISMMMLVHIEMSIFTLLATICMMTGKIGYLVGFSIYLTIALIVTIIIYMSKMYKHNK